jgi:hypothetical protein
MVLRDSAWNSSAAVGHWRGISYQYAVQLRPPPRLPLCTWKNFDPLKKDPPKPTAFASARMPMLFW